MGKLRLELQTASVPGPHRDSDNAALRELRTVTVEPRIYSIADASWNFFIKSGFLCSTVLESENNSESAAATRSSSFLQVLLLPRAQFCNQSYVTSVQCKSLGDPDSDIRSPELQFVISFKSCVPVTGVQARKWMQNIYTVRIIQKITRCCSAPSRAPSY